jgi:hypothetical protein
MNKKSRAILFGSLFLALIVGWMLSSKIAASAVPHPKLFKSTRYPPVTPEEQAMWDWWHTMEKIDPKFEWKMPIEFYGLVVDQSGQPVAKAVIDYQWTTVIGPKPDPAAQALTGNDGKFAITGIRGKRLVIDVTKEGFLRTPTSRGSYEYAAFHEELFHVPDRDNPVVFHLQKLIGAEPMLKYLPNGHFSIGEEVFLNVESGKFGQAGDLGIRVTSDSDQASATDGYSVVIRAESGAGFVMSEEPFMFKAPDSGYESEMTYNETAKGAGSTRVVKASFYARSRSGKFASVELELHYLPKWNEVNFIAVIYFNPSGSHNLEFDQRKWLNRD